MEVGIKGPIALFSQIEILSVNLACPSRDYNCAAPRL